MTGRLRKISEVGDPTPGRMRRIDIDGHRLLLANVEGEYLVVDDTCTHEDASLCTGALQGDRVKCPLHGSRFDLRTGKALEEPAEDPLSTYRVVVEGGDILVDLS